MSGPTDDQDAGDTPVQRTVSASNCPPPPTATANSVFTWGDAYRASDAPAPTAAPEPQPHEENLMATAKKKRAARARKSSNGSPQLQICSALLQGDLTREAIAEACPDLSAQQLASALNNAKTQGRIALIEKDGVFRLTKTGKEWVQATAGDEPPVENPKRRAATRKTAHRRRKAKAPELDTSPTDDESAEATFRCAILSDGAFFISKGEAIIELEIDETRRMFAYLDRLREAET